MTPENFVYWLQGFLEIGKSSGLTPNQIQEIEDRIQLVLKKEISYSKTIEVHKPLPYYDPNATFDDSEFIPLDWRHHGDWSTCTAGVNIN